MALVEDVRPTESWREVKRRLWNPPNKVRDRGIDLRRHLREPEPEPPTIVIERPAEISDDAYLVEVLNQTKETNSARRIQRAVCFYYGCSRADLVGSSRHSKIIRPRHVAMYLCRTMTDLSTPFIARQFGGRDHTTIVHACQKIEAQKGNDPALDAEIAAITKLVEGMQ